jgi:hypothetical protein
MKMTKCDKIFAAMKLPFLSVETREGEMKKICRKVTEEIYEISSKHCKDVSWLGGGKMGGSLRDCYFV